jgi:short-subunit dehydrogenase
MNGDTRPLALVTGASSGIGLALAHQFAEHDFDLVLVDDAATVYDAVRQMFRYDVEVRAIEESLETDESVLRLWSALRRLNRPVDAGALNADVAANGRFVRGTNLVDELRTIDINVRSTVQLAKLLLTDMTARGHGRLLVTSSIDALLPGTNQAVYAASKAFLDSFGELVRAELRGTGVTLTTVLPGPIFDGATIFGAAPRITTRAVAQQAYDAMMRGKDHAVAGSIIDRLIVIAARVIPDPAKAAVNAWIARPGSPQEAVASRVLRAADLTTASVQQAAAQGRRLASSLRQS